VRSVFVSTYMSLECAFRLCQYLHESGMCVSSLSVLTCVWNVRVVFVSTYMSLVCACRLCQYLHESEMCVPFLSVLMWVWIPGRAGGVVWEEEVRDPAARRDAGGVPRWRCERQGLLAPRDQPHRPHRVRSAARDAHTADEQTVGIEGRSSLYTSVSYNMCICHTLQLCLTNIRFSKDSYSLPSYLSFYNQQTPVVFFF